MASAIKVLVAGIGGASLGTEIIKALHVADKYTIYGCDISELAYGHYMKECKKTVRINRENYIEDIIRFCNAEEIKFVIPGGEGPLQLIKENQAKLEAEGIIPVINNGVVIDLCSNKDQTFTKLSQLGFEVPLTINIETLTDVEKVNFFPCVVKPATGTGGSSFVFLAENAEELTMYVHYLLKNSKKVIVQEYIPHFEGEYTIGVLSLTDGEIAGTVCLKRVFHNKLSIMHQSDVGLISSGYTQGIIENNEALCEAAEQIAKAIGSTGPLNIQGRVRNGKLIPFEINPRFSASTYLRTLADFNEIDAYLQHLTEPKSGKIVLKAKEGYCARSFTEIFVEGV